MYALVDTIAWVIRKECRVVFPNVSKGVRGLVTKVPELVIGIVDRRHGHCAALIDHARRAWRLTRLQDPDGGQRSCIERLSIEPVVL